MSDRPAWDNQFAETEGERNARLAAARKAAQTRRLRPPGECPFCDRHRDDTMMPSHTASDRCESGKHPHCTCDVCF